MTKAGKGGSAAKKPKAPAKPKRSKASVKPKPAPAPSRMNQSLEEAEVIRKGTYDYVIHPVMDGVPRCDPELIREFVAWAKTQPSVADATLIATPEAMGIPLAVALSLETGLPYTIIRKRQYDLPGEEVAFCETGYGESCLHINDCWPDDRVLVVDDVLSTGGTLQGILATLASMKVPVAGVLVAVDKGVKRDDLARRHKVEIATWKTIRVAKKKVQVLSGGP